MIYLVYYKTTRW